MSPSRDTATHTDSSARCEHCHWKNEARNSLATAAQHHDRTGHVVVVTIHRTVVYGDPLAPLPGQIELVHEPGEPT